MIYERASVYVLHVANGGLFMSDPESIRDAVTGNRLVNGAMPLAQERVTQVLEAIRDRNGNALSELGVVNPYAGSVHTFHNFVEFDEEAYDGFTADFPAYFMLTSVADALAQGNGYKDYIEQRNNISLIFDAGGRAHLDQMFAQAWSFRWKHPSGNIHWMRFASHHDRYRNNNSGRVVFLDRFCQGVFARGSINRPGRSVGIALDEFVDQNTSSNPRPTPPPQVENLKVKDVEAYLARNPHVIAKYLTTHAAQIAPHVPFKALDNLVGIHRQNVDDRREPEPGRMGLARGFQALELD